MNPDINIVLMTSRSGSSMVCRVLAEHGLSWQQGGQDPIQTGNRVIPSYRTYEHPGWKRTMKVCAGGNWPQGELVEVTNRKLNHVKDSWNKFDRVDFIKVGVELAALWLAFADLMRINVNFIKVYRNPCRVADSIERRGIGSWEQAHEVAVKRFGLMDSFEGHPVWTDKLVAGDWIGSGIVRAVSSTGKGWSQHKTQKAIEVKKFHV